MIETVAEIPSTNGALMVRLGRGEGPAEGHWLVADRQSAGRGRAGRQWSDGYGNFMGSTVAWLRPADPPAPTLSLVAGVAAHRAVMACAPGLADVLLKWPNDILVGGAKLAGILLERLGDAIVVGIGVNLAVAPDVAGRRTASLAGLGHPVTRDAFAGELVRAWDEVLAAWHAGHWDTLREDWLARAHPSGTLLSVQDPQVGPLIGAFAGLDANGAAILRMADGQCRAVNAGDMELVRD